MYVRYKKQLLEQFGNQHEITMKAKKWNMVKHFHGFPKDSDFQLVEEELPELQNDVDPYMRPYMRSFPEGTTMIGQSVSRVAGTKNGEYPLGSLYLTSFGWRSHYIHKPTAEAKDKYPPTAIPVTDVSPLPNSYLLGCLGMPGCTAYFGLLKLCEPKAGETVVVSGAAGAVGSVVGQIAKIKGCTVIGYAGTDEKCAWLKELGFDHAYNYKTCDLKKSLTEAAPKGIDCYFDNVGGDFSCDVINQMNLYGRVAMCGAISLYNDTEPRKVPFPFGTIVGKQIKLNGFIVSRWYSEYPSAIKELAQWIKEGKLKHQEHVTKGFDKMTNAFYGLLKGENTGKAIVSALDSSEL